jgi:hypothetical protein
VKIDVHTPLERAYDRPGLQLREDDESTEENVVDGYDHRQRVDRKHPGDATDYQEKPTPSREPAKRPWGVSRGHRVDLGAGTDGAQKRSGQSHWQVEDRAWGQVRDPARTDLMLSRVFVNVSAIVYFYFYVFTRPPSHVVLGCGLCPAQPIGCLVVF